MKNSFFFFINIASNHLFFLIIIGFIIHFLLPSQVFAEELGINVYGLSYHKERTYTDKGEEKKWNEINPGAGLNYIFHLKGNHIFFHDGGIYNDSKYRLSSYISSGYKYKLLKNTQIGMAGAFFLSFNKENAGYGILSSISYQYNSITINFLTPVTLEGLVVYITLRIK